MIHCAIDGRELEAREGTTVLDLARNEGIVIPTLCYHKALGPYGACRLCIVEAGGAGLQGRAVLASCTLKAVEGLVVETSTPRIISMRKTILSLLLSGTVPTSPLKALVAASGIRRKRFSIERADHCILCGLCVRVCRDSIGAGALSFTTEGRNSRRMVEAVTLSERACIGCGACAAVCPVGAVKVKDTAAKRKILLYGEAASRLDLVPCSSCGAHYATQRFIDSVLDRVGGAAARHAVPLLCPECSRRYYAEALTGQFPVGEDK